MAIVTVASLVEMQNTMRISVRTADGWNPNAVILNVNFVKTDLINPKVSIYDHVRTEIKIFKRWESYL